ncbi:MAG: peptide deformylase [Phycisphaerae bacterium]|nr:peptide deformylase [Phycisphaerae bacterium]
MKPGQIDPAKLRIILYPDPRLRVRCRPVERFDELLAAVAARMIDLMHAAEGVGLAAPQVGLPWRLFVCQPDKERPPSVIVNPVLEHSAATIASPEGCLSIPEVTVEMIRAARCELTARDLNGREIRSSGDALAARVWQHETDHLNGRLIIDRMSETEKIANRKKLRELEQKFERAKKKRV